MFILPGEFAKRDWFLNMLTTLYQLIACNKSFKNEQMSFAQNRDDM